MDGARRGVGVLEQVDIERLHGGLLRAPGLERSPTPVADDPRLSARRARVDHPPVAVPGVPLGPLLAPAGEQQGELAARGLREHVEAPAEAAVGALKRGPSVAHPSDVLEAVPEALASVVVGRVERRVLLGPITGGHAKQDATAAEHVGARGRLCDVRGVAKGEHHAGHAEGDGLGRAREQAQVDEGIEELARVTKARHVEGDVPQPDRREAEGLGQTHPLEVVGHGRHGALGVALDGHDQADGQALGLEHRGVAAIDAVEGARLGGGSDGPGDGHGTLSSTNLGYRWWSPTGRCCSVRPPNA